MSPEQPEDHSKRQQILDDLRTLRKLLDEEDEQNIPVLSDVVSNTPATEDIVIPQSAKPMSSTAKSIFTADNSQDTFKLSPSPTATAVELSEPPSVPAKQTIESNIQRQETQLTLPPVEELAAEIGEPQPVSESELQPIEPYAINVDELVEKLLEDIVEEIRPSVKSAIIKALKTPSK